MKYEHTPGPWNAAVPKNEEDLYARVSGQGWGSFAKVVVRMTNARELKPEGLANLRLMTAAPVMLGALCACLEYDQIPDDLHGVICEAITRATGDPHPGHKPCALSRDLYDSLMAACSTAGHHEARDQLKQLWEKA